MPELVNMRVGSLPGTSGLDATTVWPLAAKKSRKVLRMSATEAGRVMWALKTGGAVRVPTRADRHQARHFRTCRGGTPGCVASGTATRRAKGYPVWLGRRTAA